MTQDIKKKKIEAAIWNVEVEFIEFRSLEKES